MSLHCPPRPCSTCPYRRDVPPGVWAPEEYVKLARYDEGPGELPELAVFHCHQENTTSRATVCVGWVGCHGFDAVAVRVAVATGALERDDVERCEATDVDLYASGSEAALAGLAGVEDPPRAARIAINKLIARRTGRLGGPDAPRP